MRRPALLAIAAVLLAGCFEEPVREELEIRFADARTAELVLATRLAGGERVEENPLLRARLDDERRRLLLGEDDWSRRFETALPATRESTFRREKGVLVAAEHRATLDLAAHPRALEDFFADTLVAVAYLADEGWAEMSISPLAPGRATRGERQRLARHLGPWTAAVARYLDAARALYAHLDANPDRARPCFQVLLGDVLGEEAPPREELLRPIEEPMVAAVEDAMAAAWEILLVDEREARSINELSRLVYDPFPARITIAVPGRIVEVEGFESLSDGRLRVRGLSLWEALESLTGVWLSPDPLLLYVGAAGGLGGLGGEPGELSLDEVLASPRRAASPAPDAADVRNWIESRLRPEPFYRVVWEEQ